MSYEPNQIEAFREKRELFEVHQYNRTLGKMEYELVAGDLIHAAQQTGKWIPLRPESFAYHFKGYAPGVPEEHAHGAVLGMLELGFLRDIGDGSVMLSEEAIESIAKRWPANRTV